ncbi:MAG: Gfo/Idh/MocA family oxidoreductase [candidate division NC10 bacterium]|nr:Gfo/Idh/MocA family oxidoreductase [candidate division NC10 bacterium]
MAIRVGVVGLGVRGRQWVQAIRATSGYELVACVDLNAETLQQGANELGIPTHQCYSRLEDALDQARPQAVVVATSIDRHVDPCQAALECGLGVLVEKPFALSLREARRLVAMAERAKAPLLVGQNYRYTRMPRAVRRLLADGVLGQVGMVTCQSYRGPMDKTTASLSLPSCILWEHSVHHIDALRYVLGQEVIAVMTQSFTLPWSPPLSTGASVQVLFAFEGRARASYCATVDSRGHEFFERGQEFYLRLVGERGTVHVFHRWIVLCEQGKYPRLVRRGPREHPEEITLLRQLEHALLTGEEPECSGRDNLNTLAVLEACARSAAEQRWVKVEGANP